MIGLIAALVLTAGVVVILLVSAGLLWWLRLTRILPALLPMALGLLMVGSFFLVIAEIPLLFGSKDERASAFSDMGYLGATFLASAGLWYIAQHFLW
jgi:hypothetical protein